MNPWVIVFLGGTNDTSVVIRGPFPTFDAARAAAVSTGQPFNWQPCQVWGPAVPPPMGTLAPINVPAGAWLAVTSAISQSGGVEPVAYYGTGWSQAAAQAWGQTQQNAGAYTYGQVPA